MLLFLIHIIICNPSTSHRPESHWIRVSIRQSCWKKVKRCTAQFCFLFQWTLHIFFYTYSAYGNMYKSAWSRDKTSSKKKIKYSKSLLHQVMGYHKWTSTESVHFQENKTDDLWEFVAGCSCHVDHGTTAQVQWKGHQWTLNSHSSLIMECDMNIWNRI